MSADTVLAAADRVSSNILLYCDYSQAPLYIEPHTSEEIIETQGKCLIFNYETPIADTLDQDTDFTHELYLALRLLSEKESPRRKIYGNEVEDSRLGHTPHETRTRYSSHAYDMVRAYMRNQRSSTPDDTPPETPGLVHAPEISWPNTSPQRAELLNLAVQEESTPESPTSTEKHQPEEEVKVEVHTSSGSEGHEEVHHP